MLSERYRPQTLADFIGQPIIDAIRQACTDSWLFDEGGERWLFESDGIAGCGKTSAAFATARALGVVDWDIERIDSRSCTVADFRELERRMRCYGIGESGRRAYVIDEIQHLSRDCQRMLLGLLESLPCHVIVIGTTTSVDWADETDGLFSRWRRFRFHKPSAADVAELLERIATSERLDVPAGWSWIGYVQGKIGRVPQAGNNIRAAVDGMPDALRAYQAGGSAGQLKGTMKIKRAG